MGVVLVVPIPSENLARRGKKRFGKLIQTSEVRHLRQEPDRIHRMNRTGEESKQCDLCEQAVGATSF